MYICIYIYILESSGRASRGLDSSRTQETKPRQYRSASSGGRVDYKYTRREACFMDALL